MVIFNCAMSLTCKVDIAHYYSGVHFFFDVFVQLTLALACFSRAIPGLVGMFLPSRYKGSKGNPAIPALMANLTGVLYAASMCHVCR